jgi:hypothetical protein
LARSFPGQPKLYIREETLLAANAKPISAQNQIALTHAWGGGEVAFAAGIRFVVPVATTRHFVIFCFKMATDYRNNAKINVVTRRWREHFPTPPSPPLPALQPPVALPIFSRSVCSWLTFH